MDLTNSERGNYPGNKVETSSQDSGIVDYEHGVDSNNSVDSKPTTTSAAVIGQWNGRRSSNCSNGSDEIQTGSHILAALGHDVKLPDVVSSISSDGSN